MSLTNTTFLLMHEFGRPVIQLDDIADSYLGVTPRRARELAGAGKLELPTFRLTAKSPCLVHISDLAALIDRRQLQARAEFEKIHGPFPMDAQAIN